MVDNKVIGVDLAKNSIQVHEATRSGRVIARRKMTRVKFAEYLVKTPATTIFMEACGTSNYWARKAKAAGHDAKLIAPQYVKPFVKRQKNDAADAEAIVEAGTRKSMNFVPHKTIEQQDLQAVIRIRDRHVANRTALTNQIRGLLAEYGVIVRQGFSWLRETLLSIQQNDKKMPANDLTPKMREELKDLGSEWTELDKTIEKYDKKIKTEAASDERCQRLVKIPGIGPITAVSLVAAVGNATEFKSGRHMAAWLGLVPRQDSTGGKTTLRGMSKEGNRCLRTLFIHGGRAVLMNCGKKTDPRSLWAKNLKEKVGMNKAAVAFANKNVRTAWALLARQTEYNPKHKPVISKSRGRPEGSPPAISLSPLSPPPSLR